MNFSDKMFSVDAGSPGSAVKIAAGLKAFSGNNEIVLLCIGTERVRGDSLGPTVGGIVFKRALPNVFVYGLPESNVTARNLTVAVDFVAAIHPERLLVVVDAALGMREQVGTVQIVKGGLSPGSATNKNLPNVGDVGVLGVVNEGFLNEMQTLISTKMNKVHFTAAVIAAGICKAFGGME